MKTIILTVALFIIGLFGGYMIGTYGNAVISPAIKKPVQPDTKPVPSYDTFTIDALSARTYTGSDIILEEELERNDDFRTFTFHFITDGKRVSGLLRKPIGSAHTYPVVVQFRGYVPKEVYTSGEGTRRSSELFAANGFITLAPDFLGFGTSDKPTDDAFIDRFETYTTAMNLLASVRTVPEADTNNVFLWGHSNGGHIALTVSEIISEATRSSTALPQPKALAVWAPVSRPFPYSILYYTDEADDFGKALRKKLAVFEERNNVDLFSLTNYLDRISMPISIDQGGSDDAVPVKWSDDLYNQLTAMGKMVNYTVYPDTDHNMNGAWNTVMEKNIKFFKKIISGR